MIFLPGSCDTCLTTLLVNSAECVDGSAVCEGCGGMINVLPGCAYAESDIPLFERLAANIQASSLSSVEAAQLALALGDSTTRRSEHETMAVTIFWLPELAEFRPLLAADKRLARRALSMIGTLLWARSRSRVSSVMLKQPAIVPDEVHPLVRDRGARARKVR